MDNTDSHSNHDGIKRLVRQVGGMNYILVKRKDPFYDQADKHD
jgi:hypothetical protein